MFSLCDKFCRGDFVLGRGDRVLVGGTPNFSGGGDTGNQENIAKNGIFYVNFHENSKNFILEFLSGYQFVFNLFSSAKRFASRITDT